MQSIESLKIISLVDNITYKRGLMAEHGLSFLIKLPDAHILFDTGQSNLLLHNAKQLGEDLTLVSHVIVSHGHYDHTGGLEAFLQINDHALIWMKKEALQNKYSLATGELTDISIPFDLNKYSHRIRFVDDAAYPLPGVCLLGQIPATTTYETVHPKLKSGSMKQPLDDTFDDELVMYCIVNKKIVVISGCAHRGIINTLNAVREHSGINEFALIIGGTHLNGMPAHRLTATSQALKQLSIDSIMPCHCTGIQAYHQLSATLQCHVAYAQTGTVIKVG
jgi:7,8-dihydropterin-6-yl-methyl-4-(beta-D-ribofuranosyl)aminobenzene 5'-phosphate synthase